MVNIPDLKQLTALMAKPVTGSLQAQGGKTNRWRGWKCRHRAT
jgi:hypothetical protein